MVMGNTAGTFTPKIPCQVTLWKNKVTPFFVAKAWDTLDDFQIWSDLKTWNLLNVMWVSKKWPKFDFWVNYPFKSTEDHRYNGFYHYNPLSALTVDN